MGVHFFRGADGGVSKDGGVEGADGSGSDADGAGSSCACCGAGGSLVDAVFDADSADGAECLGVHFLRAAGAGAAAPGSGSLACAEVACATGCSVA